MKISYLGWTMVRAFMYKRINFKKNKGLVQYIDELTIKIVHEIIEISNNWTILLTFCLWSSYDHSTMNIP